MPKGSTFSQHFFAVLLLCLWPAVLGVLFVRSLGVEGLLPYLVILTVPITSAGLTMLAIALAPSLLPGGKVVFPANLILPLIYCVMMLACVVMGTSTGNSLVMPLSPVGLVTFWLNWPALVLVILFQVGSLSMLARRYKSKPVDSA